MTEPVLEIEAMKKIVDALNPFDADMKTRILQSVAILLKMKLR